MTPSEGLIIHFSASWFSSMYWIAGVHVAWFGARMVYRLGSAA